MKFLWIFIILAFSNLSHATDVLCISVLDRNEDLSGSSTELLNQLNRAAASKAYISFSTREPYGTEIKPQLSIPSTHFEGWVEQVFPGIGGVMVKVTKYITLYHSSSEFKKSYTFKLADIQEKSFKFADIQPKSLDDPDAFPIPNKFVPNKNDFYPTLVQAQLQDAQTKGKLKEISEEEPQLMKLLSVLSVLADPNQSSGQALPKELVEFIKPGQQLILTFSAGNKTVSLVVRRKSGNNFSFGDQELAELPFDSHMQENDLDPVTGVPVLRKHVYNRVFPDIVNLRNHLQYIRLSLLATQIRQQFPAIFREWENAIPQGVHTPEFYDLLTSYLGIHFVLNRGFVEQISNDSKQSLQKLAAIKYLLANKKVFWATGNQGVKMGIYDAKKFEPPKENIYNRTALELYYSELFLALRRSGREYRDGEWIRP